MTLKKPLKGLMADDHISFHFNRPASTCNHYYRKVTIIPTGGAKCLVIPGVRPKKEASLISTIKKSQNWKTITRYAYKIPPEFYSFLWRIHVTGDWRKVKLRALNAFGSQEIKNIRKTYKRYQTALQQNLSPGQVFLVPDRDIAFQSKRRFRQIYARHVLVVYCRGDELVFVPFSNKIDLMNRELDILFDASDVTGSLYTDARPAVENVPYKIFRRKTALVLSAAQPMIRERFVETALVSIGAVRRELLDFAQLKLKKM